MTNPTILPDLAAVQPVPFPNNTKATTAFTVDAEELMDQGDGPLPFLVDSLLHKTGLACLAGSSDMGKSALLRQLAIAVAAGEESFLGWKLNAVHRSAIYVSTEDGREATRCLVREQSRHLQPGQLKGLRFVFDDTNLAANLDNELNERPADLIVVDCLHDVFGGSLRDTRRIRSFLHPFHLLAEKHGCLVLFLHHLDKRTEYLEPDKNNLLNGESFEAKMHLVMELRRDPIYPERRHLCVVKGTYLQRHAKGESYVLRFDERLFTHSNTDERYPFTLLVKPVVKEKKNQNKNVARDKYWQAIDLQRMGLSYREIAEKMGYTAKSSVAAIFQRARDERWDTQLFKNKEEEKKVVVVDEYSEEAKCPANCPCGGNCQDKLPKGYRYRVF